MTDLGKVDFDSSSVSGGSEGEEVGVVSSQQARTMLVLPVLTPRGRLPVRLRCASLDDPR
jgi:hypothetical protein